MYILSDSKEREDFYGLIDDAKNVGNVGQLRWIGKMFLSVSCLKLFSYSNGATRVSPRGRSDNNVNVCIHGWSC